LLPLDTLIESIDHNPHNDNDARCCCLTVWSRNPNNLAKEGTLLLEEIASRPHAAWHFVDLASVDNRRPHTGPVNILTYYTIIHVDQITDYRPPSANSVD
jgi:hypothetical protein